MPFETLALHVLKGRLLRNCQGKGLVLQPWLCDTSLSPLISHLLFLLLIFPLSFPSPFLLLLFHILLAHARGCYQHAALLSNLTWASKSVRSLTALLPLEGIARNIHDIYVPIFLEKPIKYRAGKSRITHLGISMKCQTPAVPHLRVIQKFSLLHISWWPENEMNGGPRKFYAETKFQGSSKY